MGLSIIYQAFGAVVAAKGKGLKRLLKKVTG